jgi:hypothetical protein
MLTSSSEAASALKLTPLELVVPMATRIKTPIHSQVLAGKHVQYKHQHHGYAKEQISPEIHQ